MRCTHHCGHTRNGHRPGSRNTNVCRENVFVQVVFYVRHFPLHAPHHHHHDHHHPPPLTGGEKLRHTLMQRQSQLQRFIVCVSRWSGMRVCFPENAVVIPIALMDESHSSIAASSPPPTSPECSFVPVCSAARPVRAPHSAEKLPR